MRISKNKKRENRFRRIFSFFLCMMLAAGLCHISACKTGNDPAAGREQAGKQEEEGRGTEGQTGLESLPEEIAGRLPVIEEFDFPVEMETVHVQIPGMEGERFLLYLSDLHLILESDQIDEKELENVRARMAWSSYEGMTAADSWKSWVNYLNAMQGDCEGVLFGADMIDFASKANVDCLREGLEELKLPWLYVRADHDLAPSYLYGVFEPDSLEYQNTISPYEEVMTMEFPEFLIAGWNNSTAQLSETGLARMKELFALGKPVILLTHVPIKPLQDESLAEKSREIWGGRELIWGEGCNNAPNETTKEFLNMIYAEDTPVCEILCGHLHFTWDGQVTEKVHQHVFGPAFERKLGVIWISGPSEKNDEKIRSNVVDKTK